MIFRSIEDGAYRAADPEHGVEFRVEHLRRDRNHELVGELSACSGILGAAITESGHHCSGTFNFSNVRDRDQWAKRLAQRARTKGLDWYGLLEELCERVMAAERDGHEPAIVLRNVGARPSTPMFDVFGIRRPCEHASGSFGLGDALKSWLELAIANDRARAGMRVAVFDWEMDKHAWRERQAKLDPEMPDVLYIKCDRPLKHDVDRLRRIVRNERIEYGFFDSAAYSTHGKPEDAVAAMGFFRAFRPIGIPGGNVIAHSRREDGDQQPFGSVFWFNSFRAVWNVKRASTSPDGDVVTLGVFPRKFNLGPHPLAVGLRVQFDGDRVYIERTDIAHS